MTANRSILIVEDEALIRMDLVDFFADEGFQVFEAEDAHQAIAILDANPGITTVMTDIQMPGSMDGLKLAHYVRDRHPPTQLIIASGIVRPKLADLPVRSRFFSKPYDLGQVLRAIG